MPLVVNATPTSLYSRERPGTHCIGGCVGPRAGLDGCGKSRPPLTGIRSPGRPARSESLYRLSYPGPYFNPLTANGRSALLTSRRCILNIYSTNIRTEYFKHAA
jgi:hypothetical protein